MFDWLLPHHSCCWSIDLHDYIIGVLAPVIIGLLLVRFGEWFSDRAMGRRGR